MKVRGITIGAIAFLIALLIATSIFVLTNKKDTVAFYYPSDNYGQLIKEDRELKLDANENRTVTLVKLYFLGPVDYYMRYNFDIAVSIRNVWTAYEVYTPALILDFNGAFLTSLQKNNFNYEWIFRGLARTLKENTSIRKIYILVNGSPIKARMGFIDLAYPILVE